MEEDNDLNDEITACPNCQREYDDADQDFLICHHCGYDAEKKRFVKKPSRSVARFGIDPNVRLDEWS